MAHLFRLVVCVLALATFSIAGAQDAPKKKRGNGKGGQNGAMLLKRLADAELTDDQLAKVKEFAAAMRTELKAITKEGLTPELAKEKRKLVDALRKAETKQKDISAKVLEEFGEEKNALFKKATAANTKFRNAVFAMLTDKQIGKLPEETKKQVAMSRKKTKGDGGNKGKGKAKGKKKDQPSDS